MVVSCKSEKLGKKRRRLVCRKNGRFTKTPIEAVRSQVHGKMAAAMGVSRAAQKVIDMLEKPKERKILKGALPPADFKALVAGIPRARRQGLPGRTTTKRPVKFNT